MWRTLPTRRVGQAGTKTQRGEVGMLFEKEEDTKEYNNTCRPA